MKVMEYRDYLEDELSDNEDGSEDSEGNEKEKEIDAKVERFRRKLISETKRRKELDLKRQKKAEQKAKMLKHASYGIKVDPFSKKTPESNSESDKGE